MNRDEKYTVIVGCGRLDASLANAISDAEGSVMMVDRDERAFRKLDAAYGGLTLLDNAVKHTPVGGEIKICVEEKDRFAVFHVLDRGEGIRAEDLPHLFERFYTSQSRRADAKRGIGLGLSICDAIAKAHGGSIIAKNREGGGAEFTFTLPMEGIQNEQSA